MSEFDSQQQPSDAAPDAVTTPEKKPSRKQQILQSLAAILEQSPGARITTAGLAQHVGVSEAALYRHFPSKAKMFEALIEFIEDTLFSRISQIHTEASTAEVRCEKVLRLLLTFCEKNPGITRILTGDPLAGETDRLRQRVTQLFDRIETQLRQILREMPMRDEPAFPGDTVVAANLMLSVAEGRISQYVRSDFSRLPTTEWDTQWQTLQSGLFRQAQGIAFSEANEEPSAETNEEPSAGTNEEPSAGTSVEPSAGTNEQPSADSD